MPKRLLAAGGAILLASSSLAQQAQPNSYTQRDVRIGAFNQVEVSGPIRVSIFVIDKPAAISLVGPPALLDDTVAEVVGDTLKIHFRPGASWSWNPGSGVTVAVTTPKLRATRVKGAAMVEVDQFDAMRGNGFSAATTGSGKIALRGLDAGQVHLATGSSGSITVEGKAQQAIYAVGGSGSIDAKRLRVQTAAIAIGGSGSIYADVARTANISGNGAGSVDVVGGATCLKAAAKVRQVECR